MRYNPLNACGGIGSMACAPLQILVTNGVPEGAPDPNVYLPIAYNAAAGCFYLYQENTGWFVGTGITFDYDEEAGILTLTQCDQILEIPVGGGSVVTEGLVQDLSFDPNTLELTLTFVDEDQDPIEVDLSALASDFYADSVTFDDDTRQLTITRTGGLPDLTTEIPAGGGDLPEGNENDVLLYGEDGVPEAGKITPAHLDLVPVPPDQEMGFFSVPGGTAPDIFENFKAISAISVNWPPNEFSLALRDRDGTLKAAPAEDPDDLVTLAQLNAALPEGTEFDVLRYGEDGVPEAGRIDIRHMVADGTPLAAGTALAPVFVYGGGGELVAGGAYPATAVPGEATIAMYAAHSTGGVDSYVLQTQSIARNLWFDATTVVAPVRQLAPVSVEMFRDAIRPLYAAIEAIDPIADPAAATVEDVAAKVNEVIATLKALLP